MLTIGLTGGIASGKSAVLGFFADWGAIALDSDRIAKRCSRKGTSGYSEIVDNFGKEILLASDEIDRKKLAALVLADAEKKTKLERILHPRIMAHLLAEVEKARQSDADVLAIEVPLLFETGLDNNFDRSLAVICSDETQFSRLREGRGLDEGQIRLWVASQWPQEKKAALADYVLRNDGSLEQLRGKAREVYEQLLEEEKERKAATLH